MNKLPSLGLEEVAESRKEVYILLKAIMVDSELSEIRKGMAVGLSTVPVCGYDRILYGY